MPRKVAQVGVETCFFRGLHGKLAPMNTLRSFPKVSPHDWATLAAVVPVPAKPSSKVKRTKGEQKAINAALWVAIDHNSLPELEKALADGASLCFRRLGRQPLWEAVSGGKLDLASRLIDAGAELDAKTLAGESLWKALAERDSEAEAHVLLSLGLSWANAVAADFLTVPAPRLALAWIRSHPTPEDGPIPSLHGRGKLAASEETLKQWLRLGTVGPAELRAALNAAWGIDASHPLSLAQALTEAGHGNKVNELMSSVWDPVLRADSPDMARACLMSGWGPGPPAPNENPYHWYHWNMPWTWRAARQPAWNLFEWLSSVPAFEAEGRAFGRAHPEVSWDIAGDSVGALEKLFAWVDETDRLPDGNTLAHRILGKYDLPKNMADWWLKNHPECLHEANDEGKTPVACIRDASLSAHVQARLMAFSMPKTAVAPSAPRRRF